MQPSCKRERRRREGEDKERFFWVERRGTEELTLDSLTLLNEVETWLNVGLGLWEQTGFKD